jgi:hypothetical protein
MVHRGLPARNLPLKNNEKYFIARKEKCPVRYSFKHKNMMKRQFIGIHKIRERVRESIYFYL